MNSMCPKFSVRSDGYAGYHAAKHGVVAFTRLPTHHLTASSRIGISAGLECQEQR